MGTCTVIDGKFSFTCQLPKNEICKIYLDDRDAVFFCSDGNPIIADMEHLTVKGGKTSQKRKSTASAASDFSRLSVKTVTISSQHVHSALSIRK